MSKLPDRGPKDHMTLTDSGDQYVIAEAYWRGGLKSRGEMDIEAAVSAFGAALSEHVMDPYKNLIAMQAALDAAWKVAR